MSSWVSSTFVWIYWKLATPFHPLVNRHVSFELLRMEENFAPVDRWFIPLFIGFRPSINWCRISSIHCSYKMGAYSSRYSLFSDLLFSFKSYPFPVHPCDCDPFLGESATGGSLNRATPKTSKWVCLKIGYIPNYSHLIGIMIINHWV